MGSTPLGHGPGAMDRDQISHGHNDRDPEAHFSEQLGARLTSPSLCFLIPMTLEMRLSGSEGRESILGGERGAVSEVINSSPDHHLLVL